MLQSQRYVYAKALLSALYARLDVTRCRLLSKDCFIDTYDHDDAAFVFAKQETYARAPRQSQLERALRASRFICYVVTLMRLYAVMMI